MLTICGPSICKFSNLVNKRGFFHWHVKKQILFHFIKKWQTISIKPTANLTTWGKICERLLHNEIFNFLITNVLFLGISQAWNFTSINSYQLPMEYKYRSMGDMKFEGFFLLYQKSLIRFGIKVPSLVFIVSFHLY